VKAATPPVLAIGAPRVLLERVERTPVLDQREARRLHAEQARSGFFSTPSASAHREEHRQPLVDLPRLVDAQADDEDDEVA